VTYLHDRDGAFTGDGHRVGAHAVARDTAGGGGGAQASGNELTVRGAVLSALKLPRSEAPDVDMELVQSGVAAVAVELNLELQPILRDGLVAHRAGRTDPRSAPRNVGWSVWQLSSTDHFSGFRAPNSLVRHGVSPRVRREWVMPNARRPDACARHPGSPMEGS